MTTHTSTSTPSAPLTHGAHVTAGTRTVHVLGGHWTNSDGTFYGYWAPCSTSLAGKNVQETSAEVTCKTCRKHLERCSDCAAPAPAAEAPAAAPAPLTEADLDAMSEREEFLGFGYLGHRINAREAIASGELHPDLARVHADLLARSDRMLLDHVNRRGLDADRVFRWANSKNGRWYGDCTIGSADFTVHAPKYLP